MKKFYESLFGNQKYEKTSETSSYKLETIKEKITILYIEEKIKETRKKEILDIVRFSFLKKDADELALNITIDRKFTEKGLYELDNKSETFGISYDIIIDNGFNIKSIFHSKTKNFSPTHKNNKKYKDIEVSDDKMLFILNNLSSLTEEKRSLFVLLFDSKIEENTTLNTLINNVSVISRRLKKESQLIKPEF